MRKHVNKLLIVLVVLFPMAAYGANLVNANYPIYVNGEKVSVQPYNLGGTTLLPIRAVSEALGVPIRWTGSSVEIDTVDIEELKKACVMIECTSSKAWSQGSGSFVDYDTVLTAYHVVEGMTDIQINGKAFKIADYNKQYDIATLKGDAHVKPVKIGDSDEIRANEAAIVIGYPGGGKANITNVKINHGGPPYMSLNQQVEKGTSGAPIFNSKGELIGIVNGSSLGVNISTGTTINIIREVL